MIVSGEKQNNVTVKMNGKFWEDKQESAKKPASSKEAAPRVRIQQPSLPFSGSNNGDDAWNRMIQLRGKAERETSREPGIVLDANEPQEELGEDRMFRSRSATRLFSSWPNGPFLRTVLTTGSAVVIGLVFGFLVLTVFSQEHLSQSYRSVLTDTVQTLTAQESAGEQLPIAGPVLPSGSGTASDTPVTPAAGTQINAELQLPEVKMFVAQAGVFQPEASAQMAAQPLDKLGIPHLLYKDSTKQYMFAAAAPSRDAVLGFASRLKEKGVDVYVKEFAFPAYQGTVSVAKPSEEAANPNVNAFFANGLALAQTLSAHSGIVITSAQPALSQEEATAMKEKHRQFLEESRLVHVPDAWKPLFNGMVNGLNQAMAARDKMAEASAGKKSDSAESYAWQVQTGVLGYLENYANWVQQVQKAE